MTYTIFNTAVQNAFTFREIGIVTASMQFFRNVGATIIIPIFGFIMNFTLGNPASVNLSKTEVLALSIHNIFLASLMLAFIGLVLVFFFKELKLGGEDTMAQEVVPIEVDETV
jgi:Na+/phosphate symporter